MTRSDVISRLQGAEALIRAHGIKSLYLFGSFARDEARGSSDVDILVEAETDEFYNLEPYMAAYQDIRQVLGGREIGYTTREGLSRHIRNDVIESAIRIF